MISVVCVFNDEHVFQSRLVASLDTQTVPYDLVAVDNRSSSFSSAAIALNSGARIAQGDWILFIHQDVVILTPDWLLQAERLLQSHSVGGWAGVAGRTPAGTSRGFFRHTEALFGSPFSIPETVQTLDEVLLIHRRLPAGVAYFDEGVPGWHAYGVDACCQALREGARNYVLPLLIWHDSKGTNLRGLAEAHAYVWRKHGHAVPAIATTCGDLPGSYTLRARLRAGFFGRVARWACEQPYKLRGFQKAYAHGLEAALEQETAGAEVIDCLHRPDPQAPIQVGAFVPWPGRRRQITHRFRGIDEANWDADCIVVATDLASELTSRPDWFELLAQRSRRLVVCMHLGDLRRSPETWAMMRRRCQTRVLAVTFDGIPTALMVLASGGEEHERRVSASPSDKRPEEPVAFGHSRENPP